ncbi:flavin reductase family protein [Methanofollis aquaemaris]|uniref:Flavin reductase family protein n=1 Tax=Methanofollis aquaemaris TaxID=126734 RepID=A0A8A3S3J7_9EURY|nr:flavin reductase family protein [Methanofollis aquaemaris]QSZ66311.1 flavin reductase family protein [Methanofollis aquaemaris]
MKRSIGAKTLLYPHPVLIICTYDAEGNPNAMNAAWGGICSSNPPSVAVSVQKSRKTYENLTAKQAFTVCIPSAKYVAEADYFGIESGKNTDKIAAAGLTAAKAAQVDAPYIEEFPVVLECRVSQSVEIGVHTQFIGEIVDVRVDESVLGEDGNPAMEKVMPFLYDSACRTYHGVGPEIAKAFSAGRALKK